MTGVYVIEVSGASGANGTSIDHLLQRYGGLGAKTSARNRTQLKIFVGQEGDRNEAILWISILL